MSTEQPNLLEYYQASTKNTKELYIGTYSWSCTRCLWQNIVIIGSMIPEMSEMSDFLKPPLVFTCDMGRPFHINIGSSYSAACAICRMTVATNQLIGHNYAY